MIHQLEAPAQIKKRCDAAVATSNYGTLAHSYFSEKRLKKFTFGDERKNFHTLAEVTVHSHIA